MPDIDYARLLSHLKEPGGVRIAESDLLTQLHHQHSQAQLDALGRVLNRERFVRSVNPPSVGTAQLILRVTMAMGASRARELLDEVAALEVGHLLRENQVQTVRETLDQLVFRGEMRLAPALAEPLSQIYVRLAHGTRRILVMFRRLVFQISQAILWLSERGLPARANAQERLLYSFEVTSEKFWRLRRVREKPPEWEMSHGRITVSEARRNVWDQTEAFQRMRNKLLAGYWESATTAGPDTTFDSIKHLYEDLLDTMLHEYQLNTERHYAVTALWYLLLQRALPVREGLGLGDVTLGPTPPPLPGDGAAV